MNVHLQIPMLYIPLNKIIFSVQKNKVPLTIGPFLGFSFGEGRGQGKGKRRGRGTGTWTFYVFGF